MQRWKELLSSIGEVHTFDYPYMQQGRRRPDPRPQLIATHRQVLIETRRDTATFLIGKSMGGRMGCHVALEEQVEGVICLSYPLCGGGDCSKLRDEVLRELRTPILFVQGTRDSLCPLDLLESVRAKMKARTSLHVVEGGDHSLMVAKRQLTASGETQEEVDQQILQAITRFVAKESGDLLPG
jgi:predicted alpha/beta-hydrolase family hydrolase